MFLGDLVGYSVFYIVAREFKWLLGCSCLRASALFLGVLCG